MRIYLNILGLPKEGKEKRYRRKKKSSTREEGFLGRQASHRSSFSFPRTAFYQDEQSQGLLPQEQEQQQQQLYPPQYPDVPEFPTGSDLQGGFTISCNDAERTCVRRELCVGGYVEDRIVQSRVSGSQY